MGLVQKLWNSLLNKDDMRKLEATVGALSRELEESRRLSDSLEGELVRTRQAIGRTEVAERSTTLRDMKIRTACVACGGNMRAGEDCAHCFMGGEGQSTRKEAPPLSGLA